MTTKIQKWGNSLAVRLPKAITQKSALREGSGVEVQESKEGIFIRIIPHKRHKASLAELLREVKTENLHTETVWGDSHGSEVW